MHNIWVIVNIICLNMTHTLIIFIRLMAYVKHHEDWVQNKLTWKKRKNFKSFYHRKYFFLLRIFWNKCSNNCSDIFEALRLRFHTSQCSIHSRMSAAILFRSSFLLRSSNRFYVIVVLGPASNTMRFKLSYRWLSWGTG